jgi:hypothetical protein
VQLFTDAVESVRRSEANQTRVPKGARWATVKGGDGPLKDRDRDALAKLERLGLATGVAYTIKEKLRRVRKAATSQAARWRLKRFLNHAYEMATGDDALAPVRKATAAVRRQIDRIIQRWYFTHFQRPLEGPELDFSGRPPPGPRLQQPGHLHRHDLTARRPDRRHHEIHLSRQSAALRPGAAIQRLKDRCMKSERAPSLTSVGALSLVHFSVDTTIRSFYCFTLCWFCVTP